MWSWNSEIKRSYVKKVNFAPEKRLCCLKFGHLFIVIMYKTRICHSLEILFEPPPLLLGERTMGRSKQVNFQYKNGGCSWNVSQVQSAFGFQKGIFNSMYFQPGRWILITLDSEFVSLNHETRLRHNCERNRGEDEKCTYWTSDSKGETQRECFKRGAVVSDFLPAPFQQKYLSAGKLKAPVDGSGVDVDVAGGGLLCCSSLPSDSFIFNWRGGNYPPLHVPWKAPEKGRMRLPELPPLLPLSSRVAGPTVPAGPGGYNTHPILYSAYFAIKRGVFSPSSCKDSPWDPPPGIVATPWVDVWLLVRIHLLFCALDFKENQRGPIMLMASCSVKRNQGLPH